MSGRVVTNWLLALAIVLGIACADSIIAAILHVIGV